MGNISFYCAICGGPLGSDWVEHGSDPDYEPCDCGECDVCINDDVSAEQLQWLNRTRVLLRKNWDFEYADRESGLRSFITGVGEYGDEHSNEYPIPNSSSDEERREHVYLYDTPHVGLPVHEACWDLLMRVQPCGSDVSLDDYEIAFRQHVGTYSQGLHWIVHEAAECMGQDWEMNPGLKWVCADPNVTDELRSVMETPPSLVDIPQTLSRPSRPVQPTDPFGLLPSHTLVSLTQYLPAGDLLSLSLSSRAVLGLLDYPYFWTAKIAAEMPYIYEKPSAAINGKSLYTALKHASEALLGLRNRGRIHRICRQIVEATRRIARMRRAVVRHPSTPRPDPSQVRKLSIHTVGFNEPLERSRDAPKSVPLDLFFCGAGGDGGGEGRTHQLAVFADEHIDVVGIGTRVGGIDGCVALMGKETETMEHVVLNRDFRRMVVFVGSDHECPTVTGFQFWYTSGERIQVGACEQGGLQQALDVGHDQEPIGLTIDRELHTTRITAFGLLLYDPSNYHQIDTRFHPARRLQSQLSWLSTPPPPEYDICPPKFTYHDRSICSRLISDYVLFPKPLVSAIMQSVGHPPGAMGSITFQFAGGDATEVKVPDVALDTPKQESLDEEDGSSVTKIEFLFSRDVDKDIHSFFQCLKIYMASGRVVTVGDPTMYRYYDLEMLEPPDGRLIGGLHFVLREHIRSVGLLVKKR